MEDQAKEAKALSTSYLVHFANAMTEWGFQATVTKTNDIHIRKLTLAYPGSNMNFECLIHFDDPESKVNTLEDGEQTYQEIKGECDAGQDVDEKALATDIKTGGWQMSNHHIYISTNVLYFKKDLLNLAAIMTYVEQHISDYIKDVK